MKNVFLFSFVWVVLSASLAGAMEIASTSRLFALIDARLELMPAVALYKAANGLAIEDRVREAVVLERAVASAGEAGLDPQTVEAFFTAQIAAAKAIQYRERAVLLFAEGPTEEALDLAQVIRPQLLALGDQFLAELADVLRRAGSISDQERALFETKVSHPRLHASERAKLFDALQAIRLAQNP